jgi:hypothetical protein
MTKTLEQEAQTAKETGIEIISCHECGAELQVPKGISLEKNKQYKNFM